MSEQAIQLMEAIRGLSPEDQIDLLGMMLDEFSPDDSLLSIDDPGLIDELNRRRDDDEGAVSWEDLKREFDASR